MRFGIVVFPGSNCDADCYRVARELLGCEAEYVWHKERDLKGADARAGGPVLGICNGFQVLLEAGLLPGAVRVNRGLRYVCRDVFLRVENNQTFFTSLYEQGSVVPMPIGHMEGNYTAPPETLEKLAQEGLVVFRYCDREGRVVDTANPNGASDSIAGISNRGGNVVGLMPHPDRCSEELLGSAAGRKMFESAVAALAAR
jgi:phosphoribosylformylglycinamidine synthase subunit PurQ / glutaminase